MKILIISLLILLILLTLPLFIFFPKPPARKEQTYDLALVLGCPCKEDGSLSRMQKRRSDHALRLYRQHAYRLLIISGNGEVIEPDGGVCAIGSGGNYALAAARALVQETDYGAADIAQKALKIASEICVFTNDHITVETV